MHVCMCEYVCVSMLVVYVTIYVYWAPQPDVVLQKFRIAVKLIIAKCMLVEEVANRHVILISICARG